METFTNFCCVCLKYEDSLETVLNFDSCGIKYCEKLIVCDPLENWDNELYSLCKTCIERLNIVYEFIQQCKTSENLRKTKLNQLNILTNETEHFTCDLCKKTFKKKRFLKSHITRIHDNEHKVSSDEEVSSNESISSSDDEDKPLKRKLKPDSFTCEYCGKQFNRQQHWSAHIRSKHTFEKPYKCKLCDAKFTTSHSLLVHNRNHNNEKPYVCSSCGKRFVCSGDLFHHNKIHLNKKEYECTVCGKRFNTTSILRTHRIVKHTEPNEWKYQCDICHRRFPINSSLTLHMKRHSGIKDHSCHICGKMFFNKSEVTKHILSHSNQKRFKCDLCQDKEYKNKEGLNKHMKVIHGLGNWKPPKLDNKFMCMLCPKKFAFNNKLQRHLLSHSGDKPFKCEFCDKKFSDTYYKRSHIRKEHGEHLEEDEDHKKYPDNV